MKKLKFIPLFPLAIIFITACSNPQPAQTSKVAVQDSTLNDTSFLADKNYLYKNVSNTQDIKLIWHREQSNNAGNNYYTDSTYKKPFTDLTPDQKTKLIAPYITQELKVDESYVRNSMNACFVAKQAKIGDIQPILIYISGDDYGSLTMILLDKNNKPLCGYNLDGGMEAGPTDIGDSLIKYDAKSYSYISNNQITTYRIYETDHTDSSKKQVTIDSNVFKSLVTQGGNILTKQVVKLRFTKN